MMRNHFMHHNEQSTNFNLIPGGDYLWFKVRKATAEEKTEMARLGMYKDTQENQLGRQPVQIQ